MALLSDFPRGWFWDDHIWWGRELNASTTFARGAAIEVPDLRTADTRTLLALREQNTMLLGTITENNALQIHWSVEDDYHPELDAYDRTTAESPGMTRWGRDVRNFRSAMYRRSLEEGALRRERVRFYIAARCTDLEGHQLRNLRAEEEYLRSVSRSLDVRLMQMQWSYSLARWDIFDTKAHARHLREILNPSLAREIAAGRIDAPVDEAKSIRANCLRSEVLPFQYGFGDQVGQGLQFDQTYHALFVVTRNPAQTKPGMMLPLLSANERSFSIVQNIYPMEVNPEIERLRDSIAELVTHAASARAAGVTDEIKSMRGRISSLLSSTVVPLKVLTVVRVWGSSPEELTARALATKGALAKLNGIGIHQVNDPVRARHLFLETLPGNVGSDYRAWDKYTENVNLADLMPVSATFTGHLAGAQALCDSSDPRQQGRSKSIGGIVGLRFWAGQDRTPQHTTVTGVNGSGKTSLMIELLSQIEHLVSYMYLQEEGMALATYATVRRLPSLALKQSSDYTLNPLDTFGLPLTGHNSDTAARVGMKFVGLSKDDDRNKRRANLIGQYVTLLYREYAEDYKDRDEGRWERLTRLTMAVESLRQNGDDFIDGFKALRSLQREDPSRVAQLTAGFREEHVIQFQTAPASRDLVAAMVFSELKPEEYPQWSTLLDVMRSGRMSSHKTGAVADELTNLETDLSQGRRFGGRVGALVDGTTNVPMFGSGLHMDTSALGDGLMKEVAGFLFPEMVRQHIMAMPRASLKMMYLDELRRILLIPNAAEYVKEMLAQLRKYAACLVTAFQTPSQIEDPELLALLMGQCKQHFLLRQNDSAEVAKLARSLRLPETAQRAILSHPLLEHQRGSKASYFTLYSDEGNGKATCGTVRVHVGKPVLYVATSNGEVFDKKAAALRRYVDPVDGVNAEVEVAEKEAAAKAAAQKLVTV